MSNEIANVVSCIVMSNDNLLLVRNRWPERKVEGWTLPCGHLNINERLEAAAARELFEETGLQSDDEPRFEFALQVLKHSATIINFVFGIPSYRGTLDTANDPDGIVTAVRFMPFEEAVSHIVYEDVQYALREWKCDKSISLIHYDLRQESDAGQ